MSGAAADEEKYGPFFGYYDSPRAKIFKRDQAKVADMEGLVQLMR